MATIGVFDSGIGGLSVLNEALRQLAGHKYLYLADSANVPYGEKSSNWVNERSLKLCSWLIQEHRCDVIVVACNTATAQAINALRKQFENIPIIGVEPGIKPGAAISPKKIIGVLATQSTLASEKFKSLLETFSNDCQFIMQAGFGLVPLIEKGDLHHPELKALIKKYLEKMLTDGVDTLVLGCTHYPFLIPMIEKEFQDQFQIIDTSAAIIKQLIRKTSYAKLQGPTKLELFTTANPDHLLQLTQQLILVGLPNVTVKASPIIL